MMPSPFEVARAAGNQGARGISEGRDASAIDNILSQAMQTNDPNVLQQGIGQILSSVSPERQDQALKFLQSRMQNLQSQREKKDIGDLYGDPRYASASPQERAQLLKDKGKSDRIKSAYGDLFGESGTPQRSSMEQSQQPGAPNDQGGFLPTGQPNQAQQGQIPMEQSQQIEDIPDNTLIKLRGHPDREVTEIVKAIEERRDTQRKIDIEEKKLKNKNELEYHKESAKYDQELNKAARNNKVQMEAVKDVEEAVKSGNVNPWMMANLFKDTGNVGDKISKALMNKDQQAIESLIPEFLAGRKEIFGVRLSDADLRLLQDKLPSIGKSKEANLIVTRLLRKYGEYSLLRQRIGSEIKKANNGLRPLGYADMIEDRFDEMSKLVVIIDPKGREIPIPAYQVGDAIQAGARLKDEQ